MNVEEIIRRARLIQAQIELVEAKHKDELSPLVSAKNLYRNALQQYLVENKLGSAKTPAGQAVLAHKTSFRVEDQAEFRHHVIGTEAWDMIVWAVKRSAAEAFESATNTLPPGVVKSSELELRLLAPEKKRTRKPTSVPPEGAPFDAFGDDEEEPTAEDQQSTEAAQ